MEPISLIAIVFAALLWNTAANAPATAAKQATDQAITTATTKTLLDVNAQTIAAAIAGWHAKRITTQPKKE